MFIHLQSRTGTPFWAPRCCWESCSFPHIRHRKASFFPSSFPLSLCSISQAWTIPLTFWVNLILLGFALFCFNSAFFYGMALTHSYSLFDLSPLSSCKEEFIENYVCVCIFFPLVFMFSTPLCLCPGWSLCLPWEGFTGFSSLALGPSVGISSSRKSSLGPPIHVRCPFSGSVVPYT